MDSSNWFRGFGLIAFLCMISTAKADLKVGDLTNALRKLDGRVVPVGTSLAKQLQEMLARNAEQRIQKARLRENKVWRQVKTKAGWIRFRDKRIGALKRSLG